MKLTTREQLLIILIWAILGIVGILYKNHFAIILAALTYGITIGCDTKKENSK